MYFSGGFTLLNIIAFIQQGKNPFYAEVTPYALATGQTARKY